MNLNWAYDILRNDPNHKDRESLEQIISTSAYYSCLYAEHVIEGRWELGEYVISKDAEYSYEYAKYAIHERFVLGEAAISEDAFCSCLYAEHVIEGRFELGEAAISEDAIHSYEYARNVIQGRLPDIMHNKMISFGIIDSSDYHVKEYFGKVLYLKA